MSAAQSKEWEPSWSQAPYGLWTIDIRGDGINAVAWRESQVSTRLDLRSDEADDGQRAPSDLDESEILVAGVNMPEADSLRTRIRNLGIHGSWKRAGIDLECPLTLPIDFDVANSRQWVSLFAAQRGFGGACCVIDCGIELTIHLVDAEGSVHRGPALPTNSNDAQSFCRTIDSEVIALAEGAAVDGPLLVITGDDAEIYRNNGRLAVQHVPDLVHRGLVELANSAKS